MVLLIPFVQIHSGHASKTRFLCICICYVIQTKSKMHCISAMRPPLKSKLQRTAMSDSKIIFVCICIGYETHSSANANMGTAKGDGRKSVTNCRKMFDDISWQLVTIYDVLWRFFFALPFPPLSPFFSPNNSFECHWTNGRQQLRNWCSSLANGVFVVGFALVCSASGRPPVWQTNSSIHLFWGGGGVHGLVDARLQTSRTLGIFESQRAPNSTEAHKKLKWPKSDSKVTPRAAPRSDHKWLKSDSKMTPKWGPESLLSQFWVTLGSVCPSHFWVIFGSLPDNPYPLN